MHGPDASASRIVDRTGRLEGGRVASVDTRVRDVYCREAGTWKIVHHHADVSQAMVDVLNRVQTYG
jgi:ketosteroid isomerase-like protein